MKNFLNCWELPSGQSAANLILKVVNIKKIVNCKYVLKYDYYITEDGHVYTGIYNRNLKTHLDKDGYVKVRMMCADNKRHTFSVHRIVAENYMPVQNMDKLQINHIDGNKENNCLSNLEWCDCLYNIRHAELLGLRDCKCENNPAAVLTNNQVLEIFRLRQDGVLKVQEIADMFSISKSTLEGIIYGQTYKNLQNTKLESSTTIM